MWLVFVLGVGAPVQGWSDRLMGLKFDRYRNGIGENVKKWRDSGGGGTIDLFEGLAGERGASWRAGGLQAGTGFVQLKRDQAFAAK